MFVASPCYALPAQPHTVASVVIHVPLSPYMPMAAFTFPWPGPKPGCPTLGVPPDAIAVDAESKMQ